MKAWSADHPKAKLMTRKRADILAAAKAAFLDAGYGGTSMESIAKNANVSIMTLYRHAQSKDVLFGAVIANACAPADELERDELEAIFMHPIGEALVASAMHFQDMLLADDTIALLRVVLAEAARFPELGELAYAGLIGHLETMSTWLLSEIEPTKALPEERRNELGRIFVNRIVGVDLLGVLLGRPGPASGDRIRHAEDARDEVMRHLEALEHSGT